MVQKMHDWPTAWPAPVHRSPVDPSIASLLLQLPAACLLRSAAAVVTQHWQLLPVALVALLVQQVCDTAAVISAVGAVTAVAAVSDAALVVAVEQLLAALVQLLSCNTTITAKTDTTDNILLAELAAIMQSCTADPRTK